MCHGPGAGMACSRGMKVPIVRSARGAVGAVGTNWGFGPVAGEIAAEDPVVCLKGLSGAGMADMSMALWDDAMLLVYPGDTGSGDGGHEDKAACLGRQGSG